MTDDPPDNGKPYDSAREQQKVAEAAHALTEGVTTVPSWWRLELERLGVLEPEELRNLAEPSPYKA